MEQTTETSAKGFDPKAHLSTLKGRAYLEARWRLVWLRTEHPDAVIRTELVEHVVGQHAVIKATVEIPGGGSASDYGSETKSDFPDYLEKASTKAISRALGALGYGTQFTDEFEEGEKNLADSPVARGRQNYDQASSVSDAQKKKIWFIGTKELKLDEDSLRKKIRELTGKDVQALTVAEASKLIEQLNAEVAKLPRAS